MEENLFIVGILLKLLSIPESENSACGLKLLVQNEASTSQLVNTLAEIQEGIDVRTLGIEHFDEILKLHKANVGKFPKVVIMKDLPENNEQSQIYVMVNVMLFRYP